MLDNLKTDDSIQEDADTLGGFNVLESDGYAFAIEMAYVDKSEGGAMSLNLSLKDKDGNMLKQTLWMTSGTAKGGNNYYIDKQGNKRYLPGFSQANAIALLAIGKELSAITPETKTIKIYDFTQSKEVPQDKEVLMELIGQEITLGVLKVIVDKTAKNDQGAYVPTGDTREQNEIDKVFRTADHLTVAEVRAEATEASFYDKWVEKNKGNTRNKAKGATSTSNGAVAGTAPNAGANSLFAK